MDPRQRPDSEEKNIPISARIDEAEKAIKVNPKDASAYLHLADVCCIGLKMGYPRVIDSVWDQRLKTVLYYRLAHIFSSSQPAEQAADTRLRANEGLKSLYSVMRYKSNPVQPYDGTATDAKNKDFREQCNSQVSKLVGEMKYDESLTICNTLLEQDPQSHLFYYYRGFCHAQLNHYEEASIDFEIWRSLEEISPGKKDSPQDKEKRAFQVEYLLAQAYYELRHVDRCHLDRARPLLYRKVNFSKSVDIQTYLLFVKVDGALYGWQRSYSGEPLGLSDVQKVVEMSCLPENARYRKEALSLFEEALAAHKDGKNKQDKKDIFEGIKKVRSVEAQAMLLEKCLKDKESPLGKILWTQRKDKPCSLKEGTLKEINKHLIELKKTLSPPIASHPNTLFADFGMPGAPNLDHDFLDQAEEAAKAAQKVSQKVKR